jgi:RNA polymerase sigma-70 factor (ECF subfamily)
MRIAYRNEEHELLAGIANGSEEAFRTLFAKYRHKVYSFSLYFTRSAFIAEDITQEVFLKIWMNRQSMTEIKNMEAWIITVTRNLCFNQLKKTAYEQKVKISLAEKELESEESTEAYISYKEQRTRIGEAVENLSPAERLVFRLNRDQGMKKEEIARQLKISPNTVKTHLVNALKKIRLFFTTHPANIFIFLFFSLKNFG